MSEPLRVVVSGAAAGVFGAHRRGLAAIGAEVVGVQDVNREGAERVAAALGCRVHDDLAGLLGEAADLCVICAPHPFHAEIAIAALHAGMHVLVEKPIAVHVGEADAMVDEAERCGRVLAVSLQMRTRLEVREAHRLIEAGAIGELQRADVLATWPRRSSYFASAPWRGSWHGEGGGVLINQGQHDQDLLCHFAGPPARVVGWTRTRLHPVETEDTVQAMLEWPNGAVGSLHISTAELDESQRIELTGTRGRLRVLPGRLEIAYAAGDFREYAASEGNPWAPPDAGEATTVEGGGGGHEGLYTDLAEALATGRPPVATGRSALVTLELANAIIYSSKTGTEVQLPLDRAAYAVLLDELKGAGRVGT
jgi:UDP-N-acetyl-2-amino-2-deoxyglucuronate dehydrogenase